MKKYNSRSEVPEKYKWDLSDFFKNEEEFNETFESVKKKTKELGKYKGCTKEIDKLVEFLNKYINTIVDLENLYVYSYLINDQELGISESIERKNKTEKLESDFYNAVSFFDPELLKLSKEEFNVIIEDDRVKEFKQDLIKTYRQKEHILTEEEEIIVSELTNSMNHFDDMSSTLLNSEHDYGKIKVDGETITIAPNNLRILLKNKDQKIRKQAYTKFYKKIDQYSQSNAMYLNSYVSMNNAIAKIRKYKDSWDSKLFGLNLTDKVFKSLVNTTENNLDVLQKYYRLKKEALGLDVLNQYDMSLELTTSEKKYTIEEAQDLIREALKPLGKDYIKRYNKIIDNRYIDYCQYKGKCSGGYSFSTLDHDSRILMSFNEDLDSVSTIAHECGHNVHHQYINANNSLQYVNAPSIIAEVASLTNECLLSSYLADNGTKEERLAGIANILGVIVSNLYGAVREGKLEEDMYKHVLKGNSLTKEYLDKITLKSLKKYYGKEVKTHKYSKKSWVNRSHYYMHFYLYSYAICISVASYVASEILKGNKEVLDKYLKFLTIGSDVWPMDAFKVLGIDLEDSKVYESAIEYFNSLIDKYKENM